MSGEARRLFISYSPDDADLRRELGQHLALLEREGGVRTWHDRKINPGDDWQGQIAHELEKADVILLLVSASFIASDYCWDVEANRALERHAQGEAWVIPVLVRACDWRTAPIADLRVLPSDERPVEEWPSRHAAWADVVAGIRQRTAGRSGCESSIPKAPWGRLRKRRLRELIRWREWAPSWTNGNEDTAGSALPVDGILKLAGILIALTALVLASTLRDQVSQWWSGRPSAQFKPVMIWIPDGRFMMGSPQTDPRRSHDADLHEVEITREFLMAQTEVTRAQYQLVMGSTPTENESLSLRWFWEEHEEFEGPRSRNPSTGSDPVCNDNCPVEAVSWLDAIRYTIELSKLEGLEPCYRITERENGVDVSWIGELDCDGYRLPTEAEWEYAARSGSEDRFVGTDEPSRICEHGNVADVSSDRGWFECDDKHPGLAEVGTFEPNGFGLHDMTGNVSEWVWDRYGVYNGDEVDPVGARSGGFRVFRGGSVIDPPDFVLVAYRSYAEPTYSGPGVGFRVARSIP